MSSLLSACAGDGHSTTARHSTTPAHARAHPSEPLTKPQALAFARAVNLTAADVPGFTVSSTDENETAAEEHRQRQLLQCAGPVVSADALAEVKSSSFELKRNIVDLGVSSEVGVARTSAVAARELAAIRSDRVRGCFSRYLDSLLKGGSYHGARVSPVAISSGTPPAPGATGSFGWRITATFTVDRLRLSLYVDILGFVIGPARVTLISSGALRPFPALIQQRLFSLLLARASAGAA